MTWVEREGRHYSDPYRIYSSVQGWDLWTYGAKPGCLGKGFPTLDKAKAFAERHKASKV